MGQCMTAWDAIYCNPSDIGPRRARIPLAIERKMAFDQLNAIRPRAIIRPHLWTRFADTPARDVGMAPGVCGATGAWARALGLEPGARDRGARVIVDLPMKGLLAPWP